MFFLYGCNNIDHIIPDKDGPGELINIDSIPEVIPKFEEVTRAGNRNPYTQFDVTYHLLPTAEGYKQKGIASWYGKKFHGRRTANGEIYNMYALTAAHTILPIPSYARVTNMSNQKSVVVRINDRGPFHSNRIIDLSYVAALKLDFVEKGTTQVEVEVITPQRTVGGDSLPTPKKTIANFEEKKQFDFSSGMYLQAGAFSTWAAAQEFHTSLVTLTSTPINLLEENHLTKIIIGPLTDLNAVNTLNHLLKKNFNITPIVLSP
ncbi:MAG: septal ring lytic transglycosylase RlpA family lipoprotein [Porticoccaceae bacterium]|nr:septal ring lytic transglycosylase RlpA family lipoprotein [Porticoccaceae bacterium]